MKAGPIFASVWVAPFRRANGTTTRSGSGYRFEPYFKCEFNRDLFYSHNMISHLGVYRRDIVENIGGFREGLEGAQDYDLALQFIETIEPENIVHVPRVLYHWRRHRGSTTRGLGEKPYSIDAGARALQEHFERTGTVATVEGSPTGIRTRYKLPSEPPLVTLIIPTRNGYRLLKNCMDSIRQKTTYPNHQILIFDNGSDQQETLEYLGKISSEPDISVRRDDRPEKQARFNSEIRFIQKRWGRKLLEDPCYSPNLTLHFEEFSYACPPRAKV